MPETNIINWHARPKLDIAAGDPIQAVLCEIATALKQLVETEEEHAIDLRGLFTEEQCMALKKQLGEGEVNIKLNLDASSEIEETAIKGVWWVTHYDQLNNKQCEIIEITPIPQILFCSKTELIESHKILEERLVF